MLNVWSYASGWKNDIEGLEILVKAVANSSLKQSLKTILIREKWMGNNYKIKEIFERHDLQEVLKLEKSPYFK